MEEYHLEEAGKFDIINKKSYKSLVAVCDEYA